MEISNHGESCDPPVAERTLVNMYGGVAYDHDSLPKVVAVHTWTPERLITSEFLIVLTKLQQGQLSQRDSQHRNRMVTKPVTARFKKTSPPYNRVMKEYSCDPAMELSSSQDKNFQEKEPASISQIQALLLTGHDDKKEDYDKSSKVVTEVFPVAEKLSLPHGLNAKSLTFPEISKRRIGNLESFHWSNIGVLTEKRPGKLSTYQHAQIEKDKVQETEGFNCHSVQKPFFKTLKEPVRGKCFGGLDMTEEKKLCQQASSDPGKTIGKSSLEMCLKGGDKEEQKTDYIIPRKRPRKSIPRKVDIQRENLHSSFHSTDSEETQSADEITSDLLNHECRTAVVSPSSSSGSGSKLPRGTKVIFKRTAGVWSVSSLKSNVKENEEDTDTWSSGKESDADRDKQSKKVCLFTNRPIAPLALCDPLDSSGEEECLSSTLDREARIKNLLRKQEELLAEVRQSRATSQNNLL